MKFEVKLPQKMRDWAVAAAGLEHGRLIDLMVDYIEKRATLPAQVECKYFLSEKPTTARVTVFDFGSKGAPAHLRIEIADAAMGRKIQQRLVRYSVENDGEVVAKREEKALRASIERILKRDRISYDKLLYGEAILTRRALQSLIQFYEQMEEPRRFDIYDVLRQETIAKADRAFVNSWLIKFFPKERDPYAGLGVTLWTLAVPQIADDLIRLVQDRRYGERRGVLCLALAKTKHPRAAEVIASVVSEDGVTRWALEALGKLRAGEHAEIVRQFLRHADADIRREAKRTLKKMGFPVETPPPPVHLVKKRASAPEECEEWSANLDIEDLSPKLETLARCVDKGFDRKEIAEVAGVVDEMKPDQTKVFRFPVTANGHKGELWVEVFMDDIDNPDLVIYAKPRVIERFRAALGTK